MALTPAHLLQRRQGVEFAPPLNPAEPNHLPAYHGGRRCLQHALLDGVLAVCDRVKTSSVQIFGT
jgi:hypothetical protein